MSLSTSTRMRPTKATSLTKAGSFTAPMSPLADRQNLLYLHDSARLAMRSDARCRRWCAKSLLEASALLTPTTRRRLQILCRIAVTIFMTTG